MLALVAFLLKVGVDYSRGAFVVFYFLAPAGLLGVRKLTKIALAAAISKGAIGRRDVVMIGDFNEIANLESRDLLAFFGAGEVNRFTLSREVDPLKRSSSYIRIIDSAAKFVRRHNCREILLELPWDDSSRIEFIRDQIKLLPVSARLLPDTQVRSLTNFKSSARQRVLAIEIQRAPLNGAQRFVKRVMDVFVGVDQFPTGVAADAMMRPMCSGSKNSTGDRVPAVTLTKASIASRLPCTAPRSCCISGGGISSVAS